jgi:hypothetical protein
MSRPCEIRIPLPFRPFQTAAETKQPDFAFAFEYVESYVRSFITI